MTKPNPGALPRGAVPASAVPASAVPARAASARAASARAASARAASASAASRIALFVSALLAGALLAGALLAGALLAGCTQPAPTRAAPADCGSAAPNAVQVDAALRDGRADPEPHRVEIPANTPVLLGISSDVAAEVHVHGYDLVYPVQPGTPACVLFVADRTGVFDVEAHPETLLLQLEVR